MDYWAETDLAWELAEVISPVLADSDRVSLFTVVGSGDPYTAIDTLLQAIAWRGVPLTDAVVARITDWLAAYAHSDDAPRLHELLRVIRSISFR